MSVSHREKADHRRRSKAMLPTALRSPAVLGWVVFFFGAGRANALLGAGLDRNPHRNWLRGPCDHRPQF